MKIEYVTDEPRTTAAGVTAIDLDLDVIGWPDGRVVLDDADEFDLHTELFGYPDATVAAAQATADDLVAAVTARAEPFGSAWELWVRGVVKAPDNA